jgi:8-oxo-dGTP diphosphatase / 2-hydroxy-dATP diphosphatase
MSVDVPPGISEDGTLNVAHSGGHAEQWLLYGKVKLYTNAFVVEDGRVRSCSLTA